jgi:hypothetical protein
LTADKKMWDTFFALETAEQLRRFLGELDGTTLEHKALLRYAATWSAVVSAKDGAFDPTAHVSRDLSSALYNNCPVIFMGTNSWATAPMHEQGYFDGQINRLTTQIVKVRAANEHAQIILAVIPEKDYVINAMFVKDKYVDRLAPAITTLRKNLETHSITLIFDEYVTPLARFQTLEDYIYPDSHLPTANYIQTFARFLRAAGVGWDDVCARLAKRIYHEYCDLNDRLSGSPPNPVDFSLPFFANEAVSLVNGNESFNTPLGDTWQVLHNKNSLDPRSLLILGDSHCSIYSKRKLTYLCANVFRKTEFFWNPCGFRSEVGTVDHPVILMEVSQRFFFKI